MNEIEIKNALIESNALMYGHFVLTSGLHSQQYIEKFRLLEQPDKTELLCKAIADKFYGKKISIVVGPMTGGIILAHITGKYLGTKAIFTERVDGKMKFKRGFNITSEDNVLITEDIITTGGSVYEVIDEIKNYNSKIAGIACIVDRSQGNVQFPYDYYPLLKLDIINYEPKDCPMCKSGIPFTKPGSTNK